MPFGDFNYLFLPRYAWVIRHVDFEDFLHIICREVEEGDLRIFGEVEGTECEIAPPSLVDYYHCVGSAIGSETSVEHFVTQPAFGTVLPTVCDYDDRAYGKGFLIEYLGGIEHIIKSLP